MIFSQIMDGDRFKDSEATQRNQPLTALTLFACCRTVGSFNRTRCIFLRSSIKLPPSQCGPLVVNVHDHGIAYGTPASGEIPQALGLIF